MKINNYLSYFLKDLFSACGCLLIINAVFLSLYSYETINTSLLWQNILAALAFTLFKSALVNKYELSKRAQWINFYVCTTLADIIIVLWLLFFSPGKIMDMNLLILYIIILLIVKVTTFIMMYIDGHSQARKLNEKLSEYRHDTNGEV